MAKTDYSKCSIFLNIAFIILFINLCTSAPINSTDNAYTQFIAELNRNKCSVPSQIQLPFDTTKINNFEYLSPYLGICQNSESNKRNKEAVVLCKEIFDNLRNIACPRKSALPDISVELSGNVCKDINAQKDSVPEDDKSLLKRLTDGLLCDIMCDSEFEKACQVLLWSFDVKKLIASVESSDEPEQPVVPDDGDINDHLKHDTTADESNPQQLSVGSENGKQSAVEAKDVNDVVGHDINDVPKPQNLNNNLEQKPIEIMTSSSNEKKATLLSVDKVIIENQSFQKPGSQDLPGVSKKSTSNLKTSTISQQSSLNSNGNNPTMLQTSKVESNVQNGNQQLQGDIIDAKVDVGNLPPKGSDNKLSIDEQTQTANLISLANKPNLELKDNTLTDNHQQDIKDNAANPPVSVNDKIAPVDEEMPNQDSDLLSNNELPNNLQDEKGPTDAAAELHNNEQNLSNPIDSLGKNKLQTTDGNDESSKKTDIHTTGSQKESQHQTTQELSLNKTSIAREEIKADQIQTKSDLRKIETKGQAQTVPINDNLISVDGTKTMLTDPKEQTVGQPSEELENTIPDTAETITVKEKMPEKSLDQKTTTVSLDSKSAIPSSLTETSTKTTVALEKMEGGNELRQPADEDHYGDLENTEDDYPRPEYDNGLYEGLKTKESNPVSIAVAKEIIPSQNEKPIEFPSRNSFGQDSSDIQLIGFPEQEDSHFFFYFLSIVLILMAGYLIFHNKQKIIALIVEGRHERNRRSHRIGYKKLETK